MGASRKKNVGKKNNLSKPKMKRKSHHKRKGSTAGNLTSAGSKRPILTTSKLHSFVIHTGKIGMYLRRLERDMRKVMLPNTSAELKVKKHNNFKDFVSNAGPLGVTHLIAFTRSELSVNLRFIRMPQGPTIHFKVEQYSVARDILSSMKRPIHFQALFRNSPLLIMNGFNNPQKKHLFLAQTMFQNMFPTINVDTVELKVVRRVVLMNYDNDTDTIDFRHYSIKAVPSDISKSTKKLVRNTKIPDLSKYKDISEFITDPGHLSESEFEGEQMEVDLPQDLSSRGCFKGTKTKLRLSEIGPRMTLKMIKIEEGVDEGEVLYHAHIQKSSKEIAELRKRVPEIKKRKLRMEKNIQHAVIRKLKARQDREKTEKAEEKRMRKEAAENAEGGELED